MRTLALSIAIAGLLVAGTAQAQQQGQQGQQGQQSPDAMKQKIYTSLDANKDGKITKEEFMSQAEERYGQFLSHLDADKDGVVTQTEFMSAQGQPGQQQGGQQQGGQQQGGQQPRQ